MLEAITNIIIASDSKRCRLDTKLVRRQYCVEMPATKINNVSTYSLQPVSFLAQLAELIV